MYMVPPLGAQLPTSTNPNLKLGLKLNLLNSNGLDPNTDAMRKVQYNTHTVPPSPGTPLC